MNETAVKRFFCGIWFAYRNGTVRRTEQGRNEITNVVEKGHKNITLNLFHVPDGKLNRFRVIFFVSSPPCLWFHFCLVSALFISLFLQAKVFSQNFENSNPIPNLVTDTVAWVLVDQWFCHFSIPVQLHSADGRKFECDLRSMYDFGNWKMKENSAPHAKWLNSGLPKGETHGHVGHYNEEWYS